MRRRPPASMGLRASTLVSRFMRTSTGFVALVSADADLRYRAALREAFDGDAAPLLFSPPTLGGSSERRGELVDRSPSEASQYRIHCVLSHVTGVAYAPLAAKMVAVALAEPSVGEVGSFDIVHRALRDRKSNFDCFVVGRVEESAIARVCGELVAGEGVVRDDQARSESRTQRTSSSCTRTLRP